jgi:phenylalanyl-tRNA synthetase beta chain
MKITLNWLKTHLDFQEDFDKEMLIRLENCLMLQGAELEETLLINPMFIGEIKSIRVVNGLDVRVCEVQIPETFASEEKTLQIFSKSPNIYEKMRVIVAPEGTRLPGGQLIGKRTAKGVVSYGLMVGEELGFMPDFVDPSSKDGVYDCGKKELGLWRYDDLLLDISAPANRWDLKSVRYLAHNLDFGTIKPLPFGKYSSQKTPISLENPTDLPCSVALVNSIKIQENIFVFMDRIGRKSSSKLQTFNDFIALDIGHPINMMDYASVDGSLKIAPREGKGFVLLDQKKELCLMGEKTLVGFEENSKNILLEVSYFETDHIASSRGASAPYFLAGVDKNQDVMGYLAYLLNGSGEFLQPIGTPPKKEQRTLELSLARYQQMTGKDMDMYVMRNILNSYRGFRADAIETVKSGCVQGSCNAKYDCNALRVHLPSWRRDIKIEQNLVNEVNRSIYLREIASLPKKHLEQRKYNFSSCQLVKNNLRNLLTSLGFEEVFTYPFLSEADGPNALKLENPLRQEASYMRTKLHSSLLPAAKKKQKEINNLKLFQIGKVYDSEDEHLALVIGGKTDKNLVFKGQKYDAKLLRYYLGFFEEKLEEKYTGKRNGLYFYEGKIRITPKKQQEKTTYEDDLSFLSEKPLTWTEISSKTPCKIVLFDQYNHGDKNSYSVTIHYNHKEEIDKFIHALQSINCQIR